jgi:ATP-dependent 26S proteasome regulatory subunit
LFSFSRFQLWEGFETTGCSNILVLGATNKKERLDDAVLRRFSLQYEVGGRGIIEGGQFRF